MGRQRLESVTLNPHNSIFRKGKNESLMPLVLLILNVSFSEGDPELICALEHGY